TLPASLGLVRVDCPGDLPERPFDPSRSPQLIILHRHRLSAGDASRLRGWRATPADAPSLILCVSPYVRYEELERSSALANVVLPEAAALDVLARHVARLLQQSVVRPARGEAVPVRIEVAAANEDLAGVLVEACTRAGHRAQQVDERSVGEFPIGRNPSP